MKANIINLLIRSTGTKCCAFAYKPLSLPIYILAFGILEGEIEVTELSVAPVANPLV